MPWPARAAAEQTSRGNGLSARRRFDDNRALPARAHRLRCPAAPAAPPLSDPRPPSRTHDALRRSPSLVRRPRRLLVAALRRGTLRNVRRPQERRDALRRVHRPWRDGDRIRRRRLRLRRDRRHVARRPGGRARARRRLGARDGANRASSTRGRCRGPRRAASTRRLRSPTACRRAPNGTTCCTPNRRRQASTRASSTGRPAWKCAPPRIGW